MNIFKKTAYTYLNLCISLFLIVVTGSYQQENNSQKGTDILSTLRQMKIQKGISIKPNRPKTIYPYTKTAKNGHFAAGVLQNKKSKPFGRKINILIKPSNYCRTVAYKFYS